jgi:DNA polymerase III subunit beta
MKVICNRGALLDALIVAGNVVAARTPKPVLQCVKLTAENDRLTVAATDLEVAIRYSDSQVQVEQAGEVLVPADKLRDIVRESNDDTVAIEVATEKDGGGGAGGTFAHIRGQDSHFKIFTQKASDFPPIPDFEGEANFEITGGLLKRLIGQTLFAAAKETQRYAINGVLMVAKGKKLSLISTDGRRLAMAKGDLISDKLPKDGAKCIIPAKAMQMMEKLIDDPEETVGFQVRENQVIVHTSSATLTSNLVEGQFPPYEDVIPKDTDKAMTAATADFLSAIRRAALLTTEESKGVRMAFSKKGLVLTSRSPESGEATINFPAKYEGTDVEIGFNPQFLTDALRVVDSDEITLELTAPNRPGLLKGGADFLYVIMPVNLQ